MPFDIQEDLYSDGWFIDENKAERYKHDLLELFEKSPEWKAIQHDADEPRPLWSDMFLDMTLYTIGQPLVFADSTTMREILYDIAPRSVLASPEEAANIIHELKAFWGFIKREYDLWGAEQCLKVLNQKTIISRVEKELSDSANFGEAKALMMQALDSGIDVTDEASMHQFTERYHLQIAAELEAADAPLSEAMQQKLDEIIAILDRICHQHLNQEYADMSKAMAEAMSQMRPSPLERGRADSWAASIVYALGRINFLFDAAQIPHMKPADLCALFEVSQRTVSSKAKVVMDALDMLKPYPDWILPSRVKGNPLTWMLAIDGMIMDIRHAPREAQEEAFRQGLIPYIPADQE